MTGLVRVAIVLILFGRTVHGSDLDAERISDRIQSHHTPHGVVGEARMASPDSSELVHIDDGDGAIWTGHYLAAESYRYAVTRSPVALAYAKRALETIRVLSTVSGSGKLSRTVFPAGSPYIDWDHPKSDWRRTTFEGRDMYYNDSVTRDQYEGVFIGLVAAYDLIDDAEVHTLSRNLITRLADYLNSRLWIIRNPHGSRKLETYIGRFDLMLSVLQIAKHVNPEKFSGTFQITKVAWGWLVGLPSATKSRKMDGSYFGYNLNMGYLSHLVRLEKDPKRRKGFLKTYMKNRTATATHQNAYFNMIDFSVNGPDPARDQETRDLLEGYLKRSLRNFAVDLTSKYKACKQGVSCAVIPIEERPYEDFLWQRHPFRLVGWGDGSIESAGVDYILPYWMARFYGVL